MTETTTNKLPLVSRDKLLEAGVYFGHKKDRWNPKMKPYIATTKKGTHILDIEKTKRTIEFAHSLVKNYATKGASFVFVGTRKQAKNTIKENALRTNSFYVSERWLGGTLTNSRTIFRRVKRMEELEKLAENNYEGYTKKEGVLFAKELAKLHRNLSGIRKMKYKPTVMIIADPKADEIAVKEARKLGVKVIGIVDTNNDPTSVDVAIPANDDSLKSVNLIITLLADAIAEVKGGEVRYAFKEDQDVVLPEEPKKERPVKKYFRKNNRFNPRNNFNRSNDKRVRKPNLNPRNQEEKTEAKPAEPKKEVVSKVEVAKSNSEKEVVVKKPVVKEVAVQKSQKTAQVNYDDLKVSELKEMLKAKGQPISGKKADLIARLKGE